MVFIPTGTDEKLDKVPVVTIAVIAINTFVWFGISGQGRGRLREIFQTWGWIPDLGNPVNIITSQFLHASLMHLVGNMIFLWAFGAFLETVVGRRRFIAYYLLGGMTAALLHSGIQLVFHSHRLGIPCVGASGAVSAVMGVFMIRCYFTKVKTAIGFFPLTWLPRRIKINAVVITGFYFAMDLYWGVKSLDWAFSIVAHWAHIGGFAFGIVVSLASGHLRAARVDQCRKKSEEYMRSGVGMRHARKNLENIVRLDPRDGWALLDLARIETRYRRDDQGEKLYRRAFNAFWGKGERDEAVTAFIEYFMKYAKPFPIDMQLRVCRELMQRKEYDMAARALELLIHKTRQAPAILGQDRLEQAYIMLGKIFADNLGLREPARDLLREFLDRFPASQSRELVARKLRLLAA